MLQRPPSRRERRAGFSQDLGASRRKRRYRQRQRRGVMCARGVEVSVIGLDFLPAGPAHQREALKGVLTLAARVAYSAHSEPTPHHSMSAQVSAAWIRSGSARSSGPSHPAATSVSPNGTDGSSIVNRSTPRRLRARCFRQRSVEDDGIGAKYSVAQRVARKFWCVGLCCEDVDVSLSA
jgi:hypothetical protein